MQELKNLRETEFNRFKREKFVVLAEYLKQQTDCRRYKRKISKSRRGPSWRNQPYLTFLINKLRPCHGAINSQPHISKSTFDFTEIVNNYWLRRGTVRHIVRFISHFPLKLQTQYLHSVVLRNVSTDYCKKVLKNGVGIFGQVASAPLTFLVKICW